MRRVVCHLPFARAICQFAQRKKQMQQGRGGECRVEIPGKSWLNPRVKGKPDSTVFITFYPFDLAQPSRIARTAIK